MAENSPANVKISDSPWSFQSGNLALDLANTMDWHAGEHPQELLNSYLDLVNWSNDHGLLTMDEVESLKVEAKRQPEAARKVLETAVNLRESIYRIFTAIAHQDQPRDADLEILKERWGEAVAAARIHSHKNRFTWTWERHVIALEQMLWPVSRAAVDLLLSRALSQVGQCADDRGCGMLFIDTSRNHSRQWCSMDSCGNRAKAQRHYIRSKQKP